MTINLANSIQAVVKQYAIPFQGVDGSAIVKTVQQHINVSSQDIIEATEIVLKKLQESS